MYLRRSRALGPVAALSRSRRLFNQRSNPSRSSVSPTVAVNSIIFLNVSVFGGWVLSESDYDLRNFLYRHFTVSNRGVLRDGQFHTCLTSVFSHRDPFHLLANMFTLYFCGPTVASLIGTRSFVSLYLTSGIISSLCHVYAPYIIPKSFPSYWKTTVNDRALGASGSVSSIVAFFCVSNPFSIIHLYGILPVPAALLGIGYIGYDLYGLYHGGTGIGNASHLGGAAVGLAAYLGWKTRR